MRYIVLLASICLVLKALPTFIIIPDLDVNCTLLDTGPPFQLLYNHSEPSYNFSITNRSCHVLVVETSYKGAPPLIQLINAKGVVFYGIGYLIVSNLEDIYYEVNILSNYEVVNTIIYLTIRNEGRSVKGSINVSQTLQLDPSKPSFLVSKGCILTPEYNTTKDFISIRSTSLIESYHAINNANYIIYNIDNIKDKYSYWGPCSYTLYSASFISSLYEHISSPTTFCKYPEHIVAYESNSIFKTNESCTLSNNAKISIPKVSTDPLTTFYNDKAISLAYVDVNNLSGLEGGECRLQLEDISLLTNNYSSCYTLLDKPCSYDSECNCDETKNRCRITEQEVIQCMLDSSSEALIELLTFKYNSSNLKLELYNKYRLKEQYYTVSYKMSACEDHCPTFILGYSLNHPECKCPRVVIKRIRTPSKIICTFLDETLEPICSNLDEYQCVHCNGPICIKGSCINKCYSLDVPFATQSNCESISRSYIACVLAGIVVNCSNYCSISNSISFDTNCVSNINQTNYNGNLNSVLGQTMPMRWSIANNVSMSFSQPKFFDWEGLFDEFIAFPYTKEVSFGSFNRSGIFSVGNLSINTIDINFTVHPNGLLEFPIVEGKNIAICSPECSNISLNIKNIVPYCNGIFLSINMSNLIESSNLIVKTLTITNLSLYLTSVEVKGDLIFTKDSYLAISEPKTINVSGCIYLDGTLNLSAITKSAKIIEHVGCLEGSFDKILLPDTEMCENASLVSQNTSLSIIFTIGCNPLYLYSGIGIGAALFILFIVIIILYARNKCFKKAVAPFSNRKHWKIVPAKSSNTYNDSLPVPIQPYVFNRAASV